MLRVGLIGFGYWGPNYARVVNELEEMELTVVCDVSGKVLSSMASKLRGVATTRNYSVVLDDDAVDAVIVSTPTSTHYEIALAALNAGKHVLCEKPLAASVAECDELIAAAERAGKVLFVGHTFLFNPAVRAMQELVESGQIGRLLYCHATRTGLGPIRQDVNALWDLAPHDLSILVSLFGRPPVSVSARGSSFLRDDIEDVVFVTLDFGDGAIASVHLSWLDPYKVRRVTAVGDQRMVVFDDVSNDEKLRVFDKGASYEAASESARGTEFGEYRAVVRDGEIRIPKVPAREPLKEQVAQFAACCAGEQLPESDGAQGREVVAILEAATASMRNGGGAVAVAVRDAVSA
jgi:predicted dehydrogenase